MAAGAVLLSDSVVELAALGFHPGVHYITCVPERGEDALLATVDRWLRKQDRETSIRLSAIAEAGLVCHGFLAICRRVEPPVNSPSCRCGFTRTVQEPPWELPGVDLIRRARVLFIKHRSDETFGPLVPLLEAWIANFVGSSIHLTIIVVTHNHFDYLKAQLPRDFNASSALSLNLGEADRHWFAGVRYIAIETGVAHATLPCTRLPSLFRVPWVALCKIVHAGFDRATIIRSLSLPPRTPISRRSRSGVGPIVNCCINAGGPVRTACLGSAIPAGTDSQRGNATTAWQRCCYRHPFLYVRHCCVKTYFCCQRACAKGCKLCGC